MTDTGNELSEILSDTPAPAVAAGAETTIETPASDTGANRDEHGRFAPKAGDTPQIEAPTMEQQPDQQRQGIPPAALQDERAKTKEAREEAAELRRQIAELTGQVSVLAQQRHPPAQQQEQAKPKDFWEAPDEFVQQALDPVQKALQRQAETFSRRMAIKEHGPEKVDAAFNALKTALQSDPNAAFEYRRIMATDDPYDEMVKWHGRSQALARVGPDPDAWLEAEIEKRLSDPAHQAKILERIQSGAVANGNANRSAPVTALPPSLSRLPGGTNTAAAGLGDDSERFAQALAR